MKRIAIVLLLALLSAAHSANELHAYHRLRDATSGGRNVIAKPRKELASAYWLTGPTDIPFKSAKSSTATTGTRTLRKFKSRDAPTSTRVLHAHKNTKSTKVPATRPAAHHTSTKMPISENAEKKPNDDVRSTQDFEVAHVETLEALALLQRDSSHSKDSIVEFIGLPAPLSPPLNNHTCFDDIDYTLDGKTCKWIGRADEVTRQAYCISEEVQAKCPLACGHCCEDDPDFTFLFTKDCEWLGKTTAGSRERQCAKRLVKESCPVACGVCFPDGSESDCSNDPSFVIRNEEKSCKWIRDRPEKNQKLCKNFSIQDACPVTCEVCKVKITHIPSISPTTVPSQLTTDMKPDLPVPTLQPIVIDAISVSPSAYPTPGPTGISSLPTVLHSSISSPPSCAPVSSGPTSECYDDPSYKAPFGSGDCGCELFQGTDCSNWSALLSCSQLDEVFDRCPDSCGSCR